MFVLWKYKSIFIAKSALILRNIETSIYLIEHASFNTMKKLKLGLFNWKIYYGHESGECFVEFQELFSKEEEMKKNLQ